MTCSSDSLTKSALEALQMPFALQIKDERWADQGRASDSDWQEMASLVLPLISDAVSKDPQGSMSRGGEVCLVFTNDTEIEVLNKTWRGKGGPTNVLSFPAEPDEDFGVEYAENTDIAEDRVLGDVILAFETITREAAEQEKTFRNHAAHLLVHGVLHLLGYDHQNDEEAGQMEGLERNILAGLDVADPYAPASTGPPGPAELNQSSDI